MSVIIFFSASKNNFLFAEMMCKQLIFCVKAATRLDFQQNQCLNIKSSIYAPSRSYLWGIVWWIVTGSCITGNDVIRNDITGTGTGNEREIISRVFSGTPLDSRYEQWNCESNLYRITIVLLPPMLNHFSLLNCAVSRD